MFTAVTAVSVIFFFFVLSFHRFWATCDLAGKNLVLVSLLWTYLGWLKRRTIEISRSWSSKKLLAADGLFKRLPLWRASPFEKWLFLLFYLSFLYLAASGFFFGLFIRRGLYGYPLLLHVTSGGIFASCLTVVVIIKARDYIEMPKPLVLDISLFDPRRLGISALRAQYASFWIFVVAGFLLIMSSLLPMMPFLRYSGQKLMFEIHRYAALVSVLAAAMFIDLECFLMEKGEAK